MVPQEGLAQSPTETTDLPAFLSITNACCVAVARKSRNAAKVLARRIDIRIFDV